MDKLSVGQRHQVDRLSEQVGQRLIDWSINETCQDVCAVITGPNGFYKKHRIKASRDFDWIESKESVFRGVSATAIVAEAKSQ